MRVPFGPYRPDLPPLANAQGLTRCKNGRPKSGGYRPVGTLAAITGGTALGERPRGSIAGISASGTGFMIAGQSGTLERRFDGAWTDVSKPAGYTLGTSDLWRFARSRQAVIAVTPNEESQWFDLNGSTEFEDLSTNAPRARHIGIIGNFPVLGDIYDPVIGVQHEAVSWPDIADSRNWPDPTSDAAAAAQADRQKLEGDDGWVTGVVSGVDVGAVFRERSIHRFDYIGGRAVFDINRVDSQHGLVIGGAAVPFERQIFYIAEDGFRVFDYTQSQNIGKDIINRTFFNDIDQTYLDRVTVGIDPDETVVWVSYAGAGNTGGLPNRLVFWDWLLNQFGEADIEHEGLVGRTVETPGSLDSPDTVDDPDDLGDPTSVDSFDDRQTTATASRMGAFSTTFVPSDFSGADLEATFETGDVELTPGQRSFVNEVRPLVDGAESTVAVASSGKRSKKRADVLYGADVPQDDDGKVPFRSDGRYHSFRTICHSGWEEAAGLEVTAFPAGNR